MAEITEVFDDIKDTVGDKGFIFLIAGAALLFFYNLTKSEDAGSGTSASVTPVIVSASYPDAVTNADVIISTLQDSLEYSEQEIKEAMKDQTGTISEQLGELGNYIETENEELKNYMDSNFTATNNYIEEGIKATQILSHNIDGDLEKIKDMIESGGGRQIDDYINPEFKSPAQNSKTTAVKATNSQKASYLAKTPYKGVSIVDGLKAVGENSSFSERAKLAAANGISNYKGTPVQNTQMLSLLKSGLLKDYN